MSRDPGLYIADIIDAITAIAKYIQGYSYEQFKVDRKTIDAVVRNLEVIGEAVKKLPDDLKNKEPEIEWRKIAGLRDILIHEYFGVDTEIIWDVIKNKLESLKRVVDSLANL
jgi:uncharacterized protein with HEPN domain